MRARLEALALGSGGALLLLSLQREVPGDVEAALGVVTMAGLAAAVAWAFVAGRADKLRPNHVRAIALAALTATAVATAATAFAPWDLGPWSARGLAVLVGAAFGAAVAATLHGLPTGRLGPSVLGHVFVLAAGCALVPLALAAVETGVSAWIGPLLALAGAASSLARGAAAPSPAAVAAGTGLWVPPGHFYSPVPDRQMVLANADRLFPPSLRELPGIDLGLDRQLQLVRELVAYRGTEDFAVEPRAGSRYCLANDFFCYGDAFAFHALLRHVRPKRVVEVGSGWSSAVLLDTSERFFDHRVECTFIEPYPERLLGLLRPGDRERLHLRVQGVQDVPLDVFTSLQAGDMLFIDSSHVCKTGSDVHHLLFEVLPRLARGVWVHIHDVFANFEYPRDWVLEGRAWNESYTLRAFLYDSRDWRIELHAATLVAAGIAEFAQLAPEWARSAGGSLWLRRQ